MRFTDHKTVGLQYFLTAFWLVAIFLLGVSAMLNSINVIATKVALIPPARR